MSDERDAFTRLGQAALDARHNGTPPERAEVSRLTLLGKLPPRQPNVALMTETPWTQVAQVAISPEGKIAVLGIEPNRGKEIVEWTVIDRRWIGEVVDGTGAEMCIDHLHYPQDSENVAFTVTRPDGKTRVFWGDWKFDANDVDSGKVESVYCYLLDDGPHHWPHCVVTYSSGEVQYIQTFKKGGGGRYDATDRLIEKVRAKEIKVLGRRPDGQFIILAKSTRVFQSVRQSIILLDLKKVEDWETDQYDHILEDSVMERDGEISFVAYNNDGYIYHVWFGGHEEIREGYNRIKNAISPAEAVVYLPSGRILIRESVEDGRLFLRDVVTSDRTELDGVQINAIVEIPSGLVINDGFILRVVLEHQEGNPIYSQILITLDDRVSELHRWNDHLVFRMGKIDKSQLGIISIQELERWLVEGGDDQPATDVFPLYTPFDRLVPTNEGTLGWHFVYGTFYIIRYPLD